MAVWQLWFVAGIVFLIAEIFTPGFVVATFGVGCIFTGIFAIFIPNLQIQIVIFVISSAAIFIGIRPFAKKYLYSPQAEKTNVDALVGKIAKVTETIDPKTDQGRAQIAGDNFKAISVNEKSIEKGKKVRVEKVEGTKVIVTQI